MSEGLCLGLCLCDFKLENIKTGMGLGSNLFHVACAMICQRQTKL